MKRFFGVVFVIAAAISMWVQPVRALDTNNFRITSYVVDMKLGRDSQNRSTLETKETITAQFPDYDQNHGLERAFVTSYDGHTTKLSVLSVTDGSGRALRYSMQNGVMRIGDANTYVHGTQTYTIDYVQRDVTRYYANTSHDEFYWDIIGTDWQVPIDAAELHLTIDDMLPPYLTGDTACYSGAYNSSTSCTISPTGAGFTASAYNLRANEGMTVAVGFQRGAFVAYQRSFAEKVLLVWGVAQAILLVAVIIGVGVIIWRYYKRMNRTKEIFPAPVEYIPPARSVMASAQIMLSPKAVTTAQLLDLAVRHYVKIYETKQRTVFKPTQYTIEIVADTKDLWPEEREWLEIAFRGNIAVGERLDLSSLHNDTAYQARMQSAGEQLKQRIRGEYGLRARDTAQQSRFRYQALAVFIVGLILLSPVIWIMAGVLFGLSFACWRLTDKGLDLRRYLEGLKEYIKMAEVDRIKMLQSPEGAEKVARIIQGTEEAQLIKLYERVLPYAVLFGLESEWNKQLGRYYEMTSTQPDWFAGQNGLFNAAVFTSAMSSFSTANNYASSVSSSSGGSTGGGFSGGGGGGGGGGGW